MADINNTNEYRASVLSALGIEDDVNLRYFADFRKVLLTKLGTDFTDEDVRNEEKFRLKFLEAIGPFGGLPLKELSGTIVSFNDAVPSLLLKSAVVSLDYEPEGYDSVVVSQSKIAPASAEPTNKNIFKGDSPNVITPCRIEYGQDFVASASASCGIRWYDANKVQIDYWSSLPNTSADGRKWRTYRINNQGGCYYFEFYGGTEPTNLMVEIGDELSSYVPYGSDYTFNFDHKIYGGSLNVINGELVSLFAADGSVLEKPEKCYLTPAKIRAINNNNIWANAGSMSVKYYSIIADN